MGRIRFYRLELNQEYGYVFLSQSGGKQENRDTRPGMVYKQSLSRVIIKPFYLNK
ncbi:uncharacterized protein ASCRUDRAFT_81070 [Ascoidea rubescens DSM 1968]|uniref:Uncharacterized protein n=1 Tax=Ascoidea rubescens DSM 1968 TaxID=1344418 RepID=A0A1D2VGQ6_9ASCO|nr:hypothetical protein ASCRUDRAFT_81070 [Ascoidea rubescens DSM 1968]ODV60673.1 hypothetical protein ASCRUDRAFT_81070 [Ascoidea rubescens DSM 1968]